MIVGRLDKHTAKTLVRAFCMVMSHVLADEFSQVRFTQWDDYAALPDRQFISLSCLEAQTGTSSTALRLPREPHFAPAPLETSPRASADAPDSLHFQASQLGRIVGAECK